MQKVKKTKIDWTNKEKKYFAVGFFEAFVIELTPNFVGKKEIIDAGVLALLKCSSFDNAIDESKEIKACKDDCKELVEFKESAFEK